MFKRIWFLFWILFALFVAVPILNSVILNWVEDDGVLATTFNASDPASWNTTGTILTANQTEHIGLTPFEDGFTKFYVPIIGIFLVLGFDRNPAILRHPFLCNIQVGHDLYPGDHRVVKLTGK